MLDALNTLVRDVSSTPSFSHSSGIMVTRVCDFLQADICALYAVDQRSGRLRIVNQEGMQEDVAAGIHLNRGQGIVGFVAERAEPVNVLDMTTHKQFFEVRGLDDRKFAVFLGVPVIHNRLVFGVLTVQRQSDPFTEEEEGFLGSLATQIAHVVARAEATLELFPTRGIPTDAPDLRFKGIPGSSGIGLGTAVVIAPPADLDLVPDRIAQDQEAEFAAFNRAVSEVAEDLREIHESMAATVGEEEMALFDAYLHMLDDEAIPADVRTEIAAGQWAPGALRRVISSHTQQLEASRSTYLAERSADVRELGQRVLARLQNVQRPVCEIPPDAILVAEEITAGMLAEFPTDRLKAIVALKGTGSSHAAILARTLDVPAVMGAEDIPVLEIDRHRLVVDGTFGEVVCNPSRSVTRHFDRVASEERDLADSLALLRDEPAETLDGHRVNLWVNIGLVGDITRSLDKGAEGIGLFRTEVVFGTRDRFPTEQEQRLIYREHMEAFDPRPVSMRTLDIGGDKQLPYFPIEERDPSLGWRGIRVTLDHPEIFLVQVRAMLKANAGLEGTLRVMLPMVTNLNEIEEAISMIDRAFREVRAEGFDCKQPQIGAMIEVPSAVYQAREIAKVVDFLAVGSNDLTQYMLAASRNNPRVADLYDEFHPAVLMAMREVVKAAHAEQKGIGVCGEMAGTPEGALLCLGMGYDVLSMNSTNLLRVKCMIRNVTRIGCRRVLARAFKLKSQENVRSLVQEHLESIGLKKLIPQHAMPELQ
ncbi:MAG: phosphoenolpyruvate--protein phosphotransferase [Pseudomonadales bacterium]|nr:phosphoenolpyruvate--protein phosphotransferase [Pseudomonadales bacterium]